MSNYWEVKFDMQNMIMIIFVIFPGKTEVEECMRLLDESNWNLEQAVQLSFNPLPPTPPLETVPVQSHEEGPSSSGQLVTPPQITDNEIRQRLITSYSNPALNPENPNFIGPRMSSLSGPVINRQNRSVVQTLYGSFWNILWWPINIAYKVLQTIFHFTLTLFFSPGPPTARQAGQEVERFITEFDNKHGVLHPRLYHGTYREAVSHAKRHLRFLLVYLHNEDDPTSVQFANNVICTNLLKSVVEDNLLFWSCSVKKREGECVSESLNKAKAPFLGLLCFKEGQMRMVYKHQGFATVEQVISRLTTSIVENEPHLNRQRSSRNRDRVSESTSSQLLMQEQDAAYQESLIRDQERARKKEEEERAIRRIQEEEERVEREKQEKIAAREALRQKLKENLPEQTKEDTLSLLFRLPNGSRVSRKFSPNTTIKEIYEFALTCDESPNFFTLVSNFPKRVLPVDGDAHNKTCVEMGIQNSTTLFVQEILSEDEESSASEADL